MDGWLVGWLICWLVGWFVCLLSLFVGIVCGYCLLVLFAVCCFLVCNTAYFPFLWSPTNVFSYFETFGANNTVNTITNVFCASEARNYSIYDAFKTSGRKNLYIDNAFVPVPSTNADICPDFSMLQDVVLIC